MIFTAGVSLETKGRSRLWVACDSYRHVFLGGENPGSKLRKAKTLGVKTISHDELMKMIEGKTKSPKLFSLKGFPWA